MFEPKKPKLGKKQKNEKFLTQKMIDSKENYWKFRFLKAKLGHNSQNKNKKNYKIWIKIAEKFDFLSRDWGKNCTQKKARIKKINHESRDTLEELDKTCLCCERWREESWGEGGQV